MLRALQEPKLARAVLAVLENPAASYSVESLASLARMSRTAFAERFSHVFGQGPMDFVQRVRLRIAARLLTATDLPVKSHRKQHRLCEPQRVQPRFRSHIRVGSLGFPQFRRA